MTYRIEELSEEEMQELRIAMRKHSSQTRAFVSLSQKINRALRESRPVRLTEVETRSKPGPCPRCNGERFIARPEDGDRDVCPTCGGEGVKRASA